MKKHIIILSIALIFPHLHAIQIIQESGNLLANPVTTFGVAVNAKVFDPATGNLYFGLANTGTPFNISCFARPTAGAVPIVQPITNQQTNPPVSLDPLEKVSIDFLALATSEGNTNGVIVAVPLDKAGALIQQTVFALPRNGFTKPTQSMPLLGTSPMPVGSNGPIVGGIVGIAANENYIFSAVYNMTAFGTPGSGIAVVNINKTQVGMQTNILLKQVAAVPGDDGIKAVPLDPTSPQIVIQGNPNIVQNRISMFWDDKLQRFYAGLQLATVVPPNVGADGDGIKSVTIGLLDPNEQGELTLYNFIDPAAVSSLTNGDATKIVAVKQTQGNPQNLSATHLNVMHNSTGPSYLIGNGGNGFISQSQATGLGTVGNLIFALPLVDLQDPLDPAQGTLANKNEFNAASGRFETPAMNADELPTYDPANPANTDRFAIVGGGPIPAQPATPISGVGSGAGTPNNDRDTLDITVVGDTVYVAIATPQTDLDDSGVFYSQAQFDNTGKIRSWTPWAQRAFPFDAFSNIPENRGDIRFVNVDPVSGTVTAVEGQTGMAVGITNWQGSIYASNLAQAVSQELPCGSSSVLDLNQTTRGLGAQGPSRYALFGGINEVVFARTTLSRAESPETPPTAPPPPYDFVPNGPGGLLTVPAPQKLVDYYDEDGELIPENFLVTQLPSGAGCVKVLEYSRQLPGPVDAPNNSNYFFAGTQLGLFVFADGGGNGFDASLLGEPNLGVLTEPPFNGSWQRVENIPGTIVDIKTSGLTLYVLATQALKNGGLRSTLYNIPFMDNISTMFAPGNINVIAQTGVAMPNSDLGGTQSFYGIQIINTGIDAKMNPTSEQLVLATNNGLFQTSTQNGVQTAIDQTEALWNVIEGSENTFFAGIGGNDSPLQTTVWPFSLQDSSNLKVFNSSNIYQLSGGLLEADMMTPQPFMFQPTQFNSNAPAPAFSNLSVINNFMTDGFRRFFINQQSNTPGVNNNIAVLPFNVVGNNVTNAGTIQAPFVASVGTFNWIQTIGGTGQIFAGTNQGVLPLQ